MSYDFESNDESDVLEELMGEYVDDRDLSDMSEDSDMDIEFFQNVIETQERFVNIRY